MIFSEIGLEEQINIIHRSYKTVKWIYRSVNWVYCSFFEWKHNDTQTKTKCPWRSFFQLLSMFFYPFRLTKHYYIQNLLNQNANFVRWTVMDPKPTIFCCFLALLGKLRKYGFVTATCKKLANLTYIIDVMKLYRCAHMIVNIFRQDTVELI